MAQVITISMSQGQIDEINATWRLRVWVLHVLACLFLLEEDLDPAAAFLVCRVVALAERPEAPSLAPEEVARCSGEAFDRAMRPLISSWLRAERARSLGRCEECGGRDDSVCSSHAPGCSQERGRYRL